MLKLIACLMLAGCATLPSYNQPLTKEQELLKCGDICIVYHADVKTAKCTPNGYTCFCECDYLK